MLCAVFKKLNSSTAAAGGRHKNRRVTLRDLSFSDSSLIAEALLGCILGKSVSLRQHGAWIKCEEVWKVKSHGL